MKVPVTKIHALELKPQCGVDLDHLPKRKHGETQRAIALGKRPHGCSRNGVWIIDGRAYCRHHAGELALMWFEEHSGKELKDA